MGTTPDSIPRRRAAGWVVGLICAAAASFAGCEDDPGGDGGGGGGPDGGALQSDGSVTPDAEAVVREDAGVEGCTFDEACGPGEICEDGECAPAQCGEEGQRGECDEGFVCLSGRCVPANPEISGAFCTTCGVTGSGSYTLHGGLEGGAVGTTQSENYRLEAGALRAFAGEEER